MKRADWKKRLEDLEKRVRELEARPIVPYVIITAPPAPPVYVPPSLPWPWPGPFYVGAPEITWTSQMPAIGMNNGGIYS